ncbi:hypothetical protein C8J46_10221 [Sphingomonas sp. PP-F2F-A104-K0414]|uniref:hypothetical protein n=1 Tax=Sphingomonas sp. PP-F2F-A104-K0414 TaxID=2135661 RepID=UPI00104E62DF|nr:hypothetical protein [Sphingomonas sp. PP-F2F-A104-K0414]TCP99883.1 hypothetical protein C8J46_10221 [Sphingomonas sp. PP-F2F-A104-K0414]
MTAPRWQHDYELLACVATRLHVQRIVGYPEVVHAGRMTARAAADGIRVMGTIACTWWAIAEGHPEAHWTQDPDLGGAWLYERIAALTIAARHPRAEAIELPNDYDFVGFADAIDTLIWWETAQPSARLIADCNRELRMPARPAAISPIPPVAPAPRPSPIARAASRAGQPFLFGVAA